MRAGILLSARDKATRLPGKALLPLGGGTVTQFLLRRLAMAERACAVVLATSTDPRDAALRDLAAADGFAAFRGSPDDKLRRYRDAARAHRFDFVVVVDGDDPFVSVAHIDRIIAFAALSEPPADFVTFDRLPLGATGFGVGAAALERVCATRPEGDTEVWGHLFRDDPAFRCVDLVEDDPRLARPDLRLTLDFPEDYALFRAVVEGLAAEARHPSFEAVMDWLGRNPRVAALNRGVQASYEVHFAASRAAVTP